MSFAPEINRNRKFEWWKLRVGGKVFLAAKGGVDLGRARSLLLRSASVYRMNHDPNFAIVTRRVDGGIEAVRID